tara:strand:- start:3558 stop:5318 length:1761 start_codon:yes stop_codon:yes gene_type:complete
MSARKIILLVGLFACGLIASLAMYIYVLVQMDKNVVSDLQQANSIMDEYMAVSSLISKGKIENLNKIEAGIKQIKQDAEPFNVSPDLHSEVAKRMTAYKKALTDKVSSEQLHKVEHEFEFAVRAYAYSVFKDVDSNSKVIVLNSAVKPILTELINAINEEQHLLEMLINKQVNFDDNFKKDVATLKAIYQSKIKDLEFLAYSGFVDREIEAKIKETTKLLEEVESTKRGMYSVLLIGFGNMPTLASLDKQAGKLAVSLDSIKSAISNPINVEMENKIAKATALIIGLLIGFIVVGIILYVISVIINNKVFIPLQNRAKEFEKLVGDVEHKVEGAKTSVDDVANSSDIIYRNSENTYNAVSGAEDNSQEVAAAINQVTSTINNISQTVENVAEMVSDANNQADNAKQGFAKLADASTRIHEAVEIIKAIADQTNLLALNASIEAARAGDAGRGFAVVASEVRKLAEKTGNATETIGELVSEIQTESQSANTTISVISNKIVEINEVSTNVRIAMTEQASAVEAISVNSNEAHNSSIRAKEDVQEIKDQITDSKSKANATTQSLSLVMSEMDNLRDKCDEFIAELSKV